MTRGAALVAVMAVALLMGWAAAQSSSGSGSCTMVIVGMAPCLGFITGNTTTPSSACCSQLSSVVKSEPQCLCSVLNGGASQFGIQVDKKQALALPSACNVKTPPASECNSAGPSGGPTTTSTTTGAAAPTATTTSTPVPSTPSTQEGSGSKATGKTTTSTTSSGSSTVAILPLTIFFLYLVSNAF